MPKNVKKQLLIVSRQPPPVGQLLRITYDAPCPISYGLNDFVGDAVVAWLQTVFDHIEAEAAREGRVIYSGAWRLFGEIARELDENGTPIFDKGLREEYSSHMDWPKMKQELVALAKEYGNHGFIEHGKLIGRSKGGTDSYIYVFLIKSVRLSVSYPSSDMVPPATGPMSDEEASNLGITAAVLQPSSVAKGTRQVVKRERQALIERFEREGNTRALDYIKRKS